MAVVLGKLALSRRYTSSPLLFKSNFAHLFGYIFWLPRFFLKKCPAAVQ
jgi:hypothetical protein